MGAACCVAAKDGTVMSGSPIETVARNARYSPSWSFRWDSCGRVAGEDLPVNWSRGGGYGNDHGEVKSATSAETAFSEEGSLLDSCRSLAWQKSPPSEGHCISSRFPPSDQAVARDIIEVKGSTDSPCASYMSPSKHTSSVLPFSSMSTSPLSSQSLLIPPNSTPSRLHHRSPGRLLCPLSDSRIRDHRSSTCSISEEPSLFLTPAWSNESNRGSNGGSSDSWSIPAFSELGTNKRERWSFNTETSDLNRDKIPRFGGRSSRSPSFDLQTCGICTRPLTERPSWWWNGQKIKSNNEIPVVSVLTCGHVYHAECLEHLTAEVNKYDPDCPVCSFGEKRAVKMSEKALKAELDPKARKRSRRCIVDSDLFSHLRSLAEESGSRKPFLTRHFSFIPRTSKSTSEIPGEGFFRTRSSTK